MTYEEFATYCEFTLRDAIELAERAPNAVATLEEIKLRLLRLVLQVQDREFVAPLLRASKPVTFRFGPKRYRNYGSHWQVYIEAVTVLCSAIDAGQDVAAKVERYRYMQQHGLSDGLTVEVVEAGQRQLADGLNNSSQLILLELLHVEADSITPTVKRDILVGAMLGPKNLNAFNQCRKLKLVESERGVGVWLTPKGLSVAKILRQR